MSTVESGQLELAADLADAADVLHRANGLNATMHTGARLARDLVPGAEQAEIRVVDRKGQTADIAWTGGGEAEADDYQCQARKDERSSLAYVFPTAARVQCTLTVYSEAGGEFDATALEVGRLVAAHVRMALEVARTIEQLTEAMRTRDVIGQATGVLMERLRLDAREAFATLVRTSQQENVKLRDIARRLTGLDGWSPNSSPN
ncbi:ANTAR domain-containing protein [Wenjunlia tyrosinilytica]|nr:GAF and ANTAR domain-containing protein [Wenjunlia tyrosinilytica]